MTLKGAIDAFKLQNPGSPYIEKGLTGMINTLENMIQVEILHTFPSVVSIIDSKIEKKSGVLVIYDWATDQAKELLLSNTPFSDIYVLYLNAMTFFQSGEWTKYNNAKGLFNARYMDAVSFYSRTQTRPQANTMRNFW